MKKGGLADSPFFRLSPLTAVTPTWPETPSRQNLDAQQPPENRKKKALAKLSKPDTVIPRHHATNRDTMQPRYHDTIIEVVRKAVKELGKEAATHRFTLDEKKAIADILYAYKRRGVKTSENEIARIAINFVISDYEENGENSVLHKAIQALNT